MVKNIKSQIVKIKVIFNYEAYEEKINNFHVENYRSAISHIKGEKIYMKFMNEQLDFLDNKRPENLIKHLNIFKIINRNISSVKTFVKLHGGMDRLVQSLPLDIQRYISIFLQYNKPVKFIKELNESVGLIKLNIKLSDILQKCDCCMKNYITLKPKNRCLCSCSNCGHRIANCKYSCY